MSTPRAIAWAVCTAIVATAVEAGPAKPDPRLAAADKALVEFGKAEAEGRYEALEALALKAVELRRAALGADAPETTSARHKLSYAYAYLGDWPRFHELIAEVYAANLAKRGPTHRETLLAHSDFALALGEIGRHVEALPVSEAAVAAYRAHAKPDDPDAITSMGNLAVLYHQLGRDTEAAALQREVLGRFRASRGDEDPLTLLALANLGDTLMQLGRFGEALAPLEEAFRVRGRTLGDEHPDTLASRHELARLYAKLGRREEGLALDQRNLVLTTEALGPDHPQTLLGLNNTAYALAEVGRLAEALPLREEHLRRVTAKRGAKHPDTLISRGNLAMTLRDLGRTAEGLALLESNLALWLEAVGPEHRLTLQGEQNLGDSYRRIGRLDEAASRLGHAHEVARRTLGTEHELTMTAGANLAATELARGRRAPALALYAELVGAVEKLRADGGLSPENRASFFADWVPYYARYAVELALDAQVDEAFRVAQLSKARTLLESVAAGFGAQPGVLPPEASAKLLAHESRVSTLALRAASATDPDKRLHLEAERNAEVRAYAALRAELAAAHPKFAQVADVRPTTPAEVAGQLPKRAVAVEYLVADDRLLALVVPRKGAPRAIVTPLAPGQSKLFDAYRALASGEAKSGLLPSGERVFTVAGDRLVVAERAPDPAAQWIKAPEAVGAALARTLLEPIAAELHGARRWVVGTDGPLALVPFEMLPFRGGVVLDDHDVGYVQSLSVYSLLAQRRGQAAAAKPLLAVGGARYPAEPGALADAEGPAAMLRARGQRWAPLPGSLAEVEGVAALFGADAVVLKDDQASEGAFRALAADGGLRRFQRLLFSTHGYLSPDEPSLSAIVLSQDAPTPGADGYLTAAELAGFDLASDVVVLSACETGRGRIVEGEGVIGLPYALFVAGNRDTVLSLWPVADESTARLMQRYFERLADGDDPVAALADSKRELRRAERKRWAAPMHWAPFVLYGDGSPARR